MTSLFFETIKCCACGEDSEHTRVGSTYTAASSDLDTCPPELERSTIKYWIQRCPHCTYCGSDLSNCDDVNLDLIQSDEYKRIIDDKKFPGKARDFLAASHLAEAAEQIQAAIWHAICAAWICDDSNEDELAKSCRNRAIALGHQAINCYEEIDESQAAGELILVDLMRRAGRFEEASSIIDMVQIENLEYLIKQVFIYEKELISAEDQRDHLGDEAVS